MAAIRRAVEAQFDTLAFIVTENSGTGSKNKFTGRKDGWSVVVTTAFFAPDSRLPQAGEQGNAEHQIGGWRISIPSNTVLDPAAKRVYRGEDDFKGPGTYEGDYDPAKNYVRGNSARLNDSLFVALGNVVGISPDADPTKWKAMTDITIVGTAPEGSNRARITIYARKIV
jgi:hypothetical protein